MSHNIYLAVIEVTNGCNLSCKHCYNKFDGHKELNEDKFDLIIKKLRANNLETIHITGGEPLLLKEKLLRYLEIAKYRGVSNVKLLTNGVMVDEMSNSFFDSWDGIQISLDGLQKKHDYIRGEGNFVKVWDGIKKIKSIGKQVDIMFTVNDINFGDYDKLYNLCKKEELNFGIEIYTKADSNTSLDVLTKDQYKQIINFCIENNIHCNDPLVNVACHNKRDLLMEKKEISGCLAGISVLVIDVDGNVYPCPRVRIKMGNIFENDLDKIIASSDFVRCNSERDFSGKCGDCKYKYICGGCRALAYSLRDDIYSDNKYCFAYEQ